MEFETLSAEPISGTRSQLLDWRKASRCQGNGDCVEVASTSGQVAVRDSTNKDGPILMYSANAWRSFLDITKRGAYDLPRLWLQSQGLARAVVSGCRCSWEGPSSVTIRVRKRNVS